MFKIIQFFRYPEKLLFLPYMVLKQVIEGTIFQKKRFPEVIIMQR